MYSMIWRLTNSTSPPAVKSATRPGILSTSRRDVALAFAQEASLLETDGRLVCGNIQKEPLRLRREVGP